MLLLDVVSSAIVMGVIHKCIFLMSDAKFILLYSVRKDGTHLFYHVNFNDLKVL